MDARSEREYGIQKEAAEVRMERYDAAPQALRRVWDAVGNEAMARWLYTLGVRDFATAERMKRALTKTN
ncbi:MAG TPA: hypothetical protein VH024_17380 [Candidatus Angelobacter sp.]|nr:hypothetical protein [Candidatus Angelobacter sp.]